MSDRHQAPAITEAEQGALREFWRVVEKVRSELDSAVEKAARQIPVFAAILEKLDPAAREQQAARGRVLERAALCEGRWVEYLDDLATQGVTYAEIGISFSDWYALLSPYREVIYDQVIPDGFAGERRVLAGMSRFLDIAMFTIADSYMARKEALVRAAEAQRDLYAKIFTESSLGKLIFEWTEPPDRRSFRLVAANAAAEAQSGEALSDRVGRTVGEAFSGFLDAGTVEHMVAAVDRNEAPQWSAHRARPGEPDRYFDVRCFALGGRFVGLVFEDVSSRKGMERDLARHMRELERSNRELDDFAYVASHDLKSPLRDIDTLAGWVVEDAAELLPDESRRHLERLRDRIGRMEKLLEDLLQYSRAGRISAPVETFSPREVAEGVVALMAPPDRFEIAISGDAPAIQTPCTPLEQILRNLVANAIKHHHRDRGHIEIAIADHSPAQLVFSVRDDGPGIPAEFHGRVFRMFQTLRPRDEVEGSGMGLAIVKKLVDAHRGNVWIESAQPHGAVVRFTWPKHWSGADGGA